MHHDSSLHMHSSTMLANTMISETQKQAKDVSSSLDFTLLASWPAKRPAGESCSTDPRVSTPAEMADLGGQMLVEPSTRSAPHPRIQLERLQAKKPVGIDWTSDDSDDDQGSTGLPWELSFAFGRG